MSTKRMHRRRRKPAARSAIGALGEFNPSSQHVPTGGCDEGEAAAGRSGWACKDAIAGAATSTASIGEKAVLAGDRRWMFERRGSPKNGDIAGGRNEMVPGVWRYAPIASCPVGAAAAGAVLVIG